MSISVIGAGVVGLSVAAECAARGLPVTVYERAADLSESCSWLAGGMIAPFCELESCEPLVAEWGAEALPWWRAKGVDLQQHGSLVVATQRELPDLKRFAALTCEHQLLSQIEVQALEPELDAQFTQGLFYPSEAHFDPRAALKTLVEYIKARGGKIFFSTPKVATKNSTTYWIDCRGFNASEALPELRPVKGEMLIVRSKEVNLTRPIRILHARFPLYIVPRGEGVYMLGATMIESEDRGRVSARSVIELLSTAIRVHPAFAEAEILETGADLRPAYPNNLPRLVEKEGVLYVNGVFRHGFLLSPALAKRAVDLILTKTQESYFANHHQWRQA